MTKYITVETFRKNNLSGDYDYFLLKAEDADLWKVMCFEVIPEEDKQRGEPDELEFQWEVTGKLVGFRDENIHREIREPFTEETAREEFERWR